MFSKRIFFLSILILINLKVFSQDANFHIYLCFGQSNMEGHAKFEAKDTIGIDKRFMLLESVDCPNLDRVKGNWYTAIPPLTRCNTGIGPVDYFGREMVRKLPENIKVGVVNVSVGGCRIELFDKDNFNSYVETSPDWLKNMVKEYYGNPYQRLVDMARIAQKSGVIKGILLHQGESNTNDTLWTKKVRGVYQNLLSDLNLKAKDVPLLAGEVVNKDQEGVCASMNNIIATLPQAIPTSYVISSAGCEAGPDKLHFSVQGYTTLGERYAQEMLSLLGYN